MASGFAGFLRRLISPTGAATDAPASEHESGTAVDYKGYAIHPTPRRQGSEWLTAGKITKAFADDVKEHDFIRAETHPSRDAAEAFAVTKAKQIIDERGDGLFPKA